MPSNKGFFGIEYCGDDADEVVALLTLLKVKVDAAFGDVDSVLLYREGLGWPLTVDCPDNIGEWRKVLAKLFEQP